MKSLAHDRPPTTDEWRALYAGAAKFHDLACWDWMFDRDIFGVQDPETGEIGYCGIMGRNRQHFALAAYHGTAGLLGIMGLYNGTIKPSDPDSMYIQDCTMVSFENREFLRPEDLAVIRSLGLKFRGASAWPLFRDHHPGDFPWFISGAQARFLTLALDQALDVAPRFREGLTLIRPDEMKYLVRVRAADGAWTDDYRLLAMPPLETLLCTEPVNEVRIEQVRRRITARTGAWEADAFHHPDAVQDRRGERPYFPYVFVLMAAESRLVLGTTVSRRGEYVTLFRETFLDALERAGTLPGQVLFVHTEVADVLRPLTGQLGIELKRAKTLKAVQEFYREFLKMTR